MARVPLLQLTAILLGAFAAGCASVDAARATDSLDLGGGLSMTSDGQILGATPPWATSGDLDDDGPSTTHARQ